MSDAPARAVVKKINLRVIEVPHKRRGRITGTDHVAIHDGYRIVCPEHGAIGEKTDAVPVATARAANHNDDYHRAGN